MATLDTIDQFDFNPISLDRLQALFQTNHIGPILRAKVAHQVHDHALVLVGLDKGYNRFECIAQRALELRWGRAIDFGKQFEGVGGNGSREQISDGIGSEFLASGPGRRGLVSVCVRDR